MLMKTKWIATGVAFAALGGCCASKISSSLDVPLTAQETSMWCWAASGKMAMDYLGASTTQCDQANQWLGRSDCCDTVPPPTECVRGGWPAYERYGFVADTTCNRWD